MFNNHERAGMPANSDQVIIEEEILSAAGLEPLD